MHGPVIGSALPLRAAGGVPGLRRSPAIGGVHRAAGIAVVNAASQAGHPPVVVGGVLVGVRTIRPSDAQAVVAMHARLSQRTRFLRYFSACPQLPPGELERIVQADHRDRETMVAEAGGRLIGLGQFARLARCPVEAEVALVVEDGVQRQGLGSVLFAQLAAAARRQRVSRFVAELLTDNLPIVSALVRAGYRVQQRPHPGGGVRLTFGI
jgi:GNAT superfamily N-acetyltransferase